MKLKILLFIAFVCVVFSSFAFSQTKEKFDFYTRGDYRTEVLRPQSILRFDVGDFHTTYAQMEKVIEAIAKAAPDRVRNYDIGTTNEHRIQHIVAISSPANMARIDEIRANNARLTDPRTISPTDANPAQELKFNKADGAPPVLPPIASPSASASKVPEAIPGAIMRGTVDRTTYLTYGLEDENLPVLLASGYFFRPLKDGTNATVFEPKPKTPLTISGFVWEGNTERLLKNTVYLIDEPTVSGHIILFAEEPFFRGIFRSMTRPFFNSILFNESF